MKIIYNNNGLKIITPCLDIDLTIIAEKDVPVGVMYKIIDESELPTDRTYRDAWAYDINEGNKDGVGLSQEQFNAKYPHLTGWAVQ